MVRDNIASMLNELPDVSVLVATDTVAFDLLQGLAPHLVLLNIGLSHVECVRIARHVRQDMPRCNVVIMDLLPEHTGIAQLISAGVAGFILSDATCEEFVQTLRSVALGDAILPARMMSNLFAQLGQSGSATDSPVRIDTSHLTPRELEVITLIAQGRSNKEIASQLSIAEHTVKTHVRNVMEKLSLNTRLQIAAYAHKKSA